MSPSTPTASLSIEPQPKTPQSSSEKSATLTLQPETGQHMEYAGKVTHREYWNATAILYAYLAGGKLYGYSFCVKPIFPT